MFRQILVALDDRKYQCIFWRDHPTQTIKVFELNTVTYGTACAPYLANRVIQQLAKDEAKRFPLVSTILEHDAYVDDIFIGAEDLILARNLRDQVIQVTSSAGFILRKWSSNNPKLLQDLQKNDHSLAIDLPFKEDLNLHVLGISWDPLSDCFTFKLHTPNLESPTKRSVLSCVAKLFDPLGWLSPIIIQAKILLQSLWLLQLSWDDPLPEETLLNWSKFQESLSSISTITIPRFIHLSYDVRSIELHGFCDASKFAYAAVVYLRVVTLTGETYVNLIAAKTKVAPIKTLSIARLELCASTLLSKLISQTQTILRIPDAQMYCWSDSMIVLCWLQKQPVNWTVFVANRVSFIQTTISKAIWGYVPSKENPADCASRGKLASELALFSLWWSGPNWLSLSSDYWPKEKVVTQEVPEKRESVKVHIAIMEWDLLYRFSSWARLLRVTAYILRFVNTLRKRKIERGFLTANEICFASDLWIRHAQKQEFANEIQDLSLGREIKSTSKLKKLNPFLDDTQILRLGGRLKHSNLSREQKFPAIVPKGIVANLIIRQFHSNLLHAGSLLTLGTLRRKFWVLGARSIVNSIIHKCVTCTRFKAQCKAQFMSDLPAVRCTPSRPFSHSGVDYAGPINVRNCSGRGNKSHKAYIALFICLSTRAVHVELVHDCTTETFLAAFKRFCSRRGIPSDVYSDNGTNFDGADRELSSTFKAIASNGTTWHFMPPASPHFGGLWEACVKSVKTHLRKMLGSLTPTSEELVTLLTQIEACLNSRPIAPLSNDPDTFDYLTPGHFLIGTSLATVPSPSVLNIKENRLSRWQVYQRILENFWRKWSRDYLFSLQQRNKWFIKLPNLSLGKMVLIRNENLPPSKWELGRIINCNPGADGIVRVVTVKTAKSQYVRPVTKLCILPINSDF